MGKGDRRSRKGKIVRKTFGNSRPRKSNITASSKPAKVEQKAESPAKKKTTKKKKEE